MTTAELTATVNAKHESITDDIEFALRAEALRLFANHPEVRLICWRMGVAQVCTNEIENWGGEEVEVKGNYPEFDGRPTPEYLADFFAIAELDDHLCNVITGRPRRYTRLADGAPSNRSLIGNRHEDLHAIQRHRRCRRLLLVQGG